MVFFFSFFFQIGLPFITLSSMSVCGISVNANLTHATDSIRDADDPGTFLYSMDVCHVDSINSVHLDDNCIIRRFLCHIYSTYLHHPGHHLNNMPHK